MVQVYQAPRDVEWVSLQNPEPARPFSFSVIRSFRRLHFRLLIKLEAGPSRFFWDVRRETSSPPDSCDYTSYYHQPRVPGPVATDPCAKRLQGLGLIQSVHSMARRLINTTINYHSAFSPLLPPFLRTRQVATTLNLAGLVSVLITTSIASKSRLPRHLYPYLCWGAYRRHFCHWQNFSSWGPQVPYYFIDSLFFQLF